MSQQEAIFLLCGYPILLAAMFAVVGLFWRSMELTARDEEKDER